MRPELRLAVVAGLAAIAIGCGGARPVAPRTGELAVGPALARASVIRGLGARGFVVEADNPGAVVATLELANVWLRIEVRYDGSSYAIEYRESLGLDARTDDDGRVHVGGAYGRYVDQLAREIERAAMLPDTLAAVPPPTAGGVVVTPPAPTLPPTPTAPPAPTAPTYAAPAATPVYAAPTAPAPVYGVALAPPTPPDTRPRRNLHEVWIPGVVVWVGSWIANWGTTLGISSEGPMIGMSFVPVIGPFLQLTQLQWADASTGLPGYERWTGLFYPVMGFTQILGLVLAIVGATIHVPVGEPDAPTATLDLTPTATESSAGLALDLRF